MNTGFDNEHYIQLQTEAIKERMSRFAGGTLYLEVGGKFLHDGHASRVLPGFDPAVKIDILSSLAADTTVLVCLNSDAVVANRPVNRNRGTYQEEALSLIQTLTDQFGKKPLVVFNLHPLEPLIPPPLLVFQTLLHQQGLHTYKRFFVEGYPHHLDHILSPAGFGKDEQIPIDTTLAIVTAPAPGAGKFSTCLGQLYHGLAAGTPTGYAKYETFPIWNLPVAHPVNLAYEAATADLGDYNMADRYHEQAYGTSAVNYNRDVEAFELLQAIIDRIAPPTSPLHDYQSPTDMGINHAGFAIADENAIIHASLTEIGHRVQWYHELVQRGEGEQSWVDRCTALLETAQQYTPSLIDIEK